MIVQATPYKKQQWTVLNSFIALTGYYMAAWLVDKPWYGRVRMQVRKLVCCQFLSLQISSTNVFGYYHVSFSVYFCK